MSNSQKKAARRVSISVTTWSTVFEEPDKDDSECSVSFTVVTPNALKGVTALNDDTDIEDDDGFNDYSEVTIDQKYDKQDKANKDLINLKPPDKTTEAVSSISKPPPCVQSARCSTLCASTYRNYRSRRKAMSALSNDEQAALKKKTVSDDSDSKVGASPAGKRKLSKFGGESVPEKKLIEGTFKLNSSINYEEYLGAIGTGPCSQDLVMRAGVVLRIHQVSLC